MCDSRALKWRNLFSYLQLWGTVLVLDLLFFFFFFFFFISPGYIIQRFGSGIIAAPQIQDYPSDGPKLKDPGPSLEPLLIKWRLTVQRKRKTKAGRMLGRTPSPNSNIQSTVMANGKWCDCQTKKPLLFSSKIYRWKQPRVFFVTHDLCCPWQFFHWQLIVRQNVADTVVLLNPG